MAAAERSGSEAELSEIDRVRDAHVAALNTGDVAAWARQFSADGVQMPPNAPPNVGRAAIEAWSRPMLEHFRVRFALSVAEVRVESAWAIETGGYTIELAPKPGGPAMQDAGKYITIYQRTREGWRMARDIWNSNNPPPPM